MIEWWGDAIMEYYAATEGGGTIITAEEWMEKPGSVGKAWPSSEIRILDDDMQRGARPAPRAPSTCRWPWPTSSTRATRRRPRRTGTTGFFTVGDWGLLDEDGYLFLKDRKSDMIISGGVNIYPAEIECDAADHPEDRRRRRVRHPPRGLGRGDQGRRRSRPRASSPTTRCATRSSPSARRTWPASSGPRRSTSSPSCPATRTASSTSASSATRTGKASSARSELGLRGWSARSAPRSSAAPASSAPPTSKACEPVST